MSPTTEMSVDRQASGEPLRTQRARLLGVWVSAGSAVAAMIAVSWYVVVAHGSQAPGGDMIGHAAAARWLQTLPWWDWRGWSGWFYGGQAIGVNYPPLGHAWMRFTHPVHGQMLAVMLGLLLVLPWGALRLARSVGYSPRAQRVAVAGVLVLVAASGNMHWVLSGFHSQSTFFGSWPAMVATVIGLHAAAFAARCRNPLRCGALIGMAALFNVTVIPGVAVVCVALLLTSDAPLSQAARWAATALSTSLAVCAWWLVPFIAGWERLVRWEVPLASAWSYGDIWQVTVLALVGGAATWAARLYGGAARRVVMAAAAGLFAAVIADLFDYLRPERWLALPILVAVIGATRLFASEAQDDSPGPVRPAWAIVVVACLIVFVVVTLRIEVLPLCAWLLWRPRRTWAWSGCLAWAAAILFVPFVAEIRSPVPSDPPPTSPLEAVAAGSGAEIDGLVYANHLYNTAAGDVRRCAWGYPWQTTIDTEGRIRPLFGLYRETSSAAEFITADVGLRGGDIGPHGRRPHWFDAWDVADRPSLDSPVRAEALGARWYTECDTDGNVNVRDLPGTRVSGVAAVAYTSELAWHRAAVEWWIAFDELASTSSASAVVPVLSSDAAETNYPFNQPAHGVSVRTGEDSIIVQAEAAGWAWVRVPWDPDWRSLSNAPVLKGGPGHMVVWAEQGQTELRWAVPDAVDVAASAVTGFSIVAALALAAMNRRRGWSVDPHRGGPIAGALDAFAETVDGWVHTATRNARRHIGRSR